MHGYKRTAWLWMATAIAALAFVAYAAEQPKSEPKTEKKAEAVAMEGTLACAMCSLSMPDMACTKECCQTCTKTGSPAVLKDAKGQLYLLLPSEHGKELLTDEVKGLFQEQVVVKGKLVENGGLRGILAESITKAPAK
ncbi:MAG: hypothetical protein NTW86_29025 [Candidatus Sumerlaeota bacterium]|nr:hypothetical protein [Candidatus Sumerlaeota bacterium]